MRKAAWIGLVVALAAGAAVCVPLPFVATEAATAPSEFSATLEDTETDGCGTVTVTAGLSGTVQHPLVDVLGIARLTGVEVTDARLSVAEEPGCGERDAVIAAGFAGITPTGECSEWNIDQEEGSAVAVDCGGTGVRLEVATDEGAGAVDGSGLTLTIAGGVTRDDVWCLRVDSGLMFRDGGASSTVASSASDVLCLDLET